MIYKLSWIAWGDDPKLAKRVLYSQYNKVDARADTGITFAQES